MQLGNGSERKKGENIPGVIIKMKHEINYPFYYLKHCHLMRMIFIPQLFILQNPKSILKERNRCPIAFVRLFELQHPTLLQEGAPEYLQYRIIFIIYCQVIFNFERIYMLVIF